MHDLTGVQFDTFAVMVDYLKQFHTYMINTLKQILGEFDENDVRWCVTVPVNYEIQHKLAYHQALVQAGFTTDHDPSCEQTVMMAYQPESAVAYMMKDACKIVQPNERFMIVDAGGGTVNISCYIMDGKTKRLKEMTIKDCATCGSHLADRAFLELIQQNVSAKCLQALLRNKKALFSLLTNWEKAKCNFKSHSQILKVALSPAFAKLLKQHNTTSTIFDFSNDIKVVRLNKQQLDGIFSSSIEKVKKLIHNQMDQLEEDVADDGFPVHYIFVVGGFGKSAALQEMISSTFKPIVKDVCFAEAIADRAVMNGAAVLAQDSSLIISRKAMYHYGIASAALYDEKRHQSEQPVFVNKYWVVHNTFKCFAAKGSNLDEDHGYVKRFETLDPAKPIEVRIYSSASDVKPVMVNEPMCQEIATAHINLPFGSKAKFVDVKMQFGKSLVQLSARTDTNESAKVSIAFANKI